MECEACGKPVDVLAECIECEKLLCKECINTHKCGVEIKTWNVMDV